MKQNQLIKLIWEKNQDLTFGEVRQATANVLKSVDIELIRVRREKEIKQLEKIKLLTEEFLSDLAGGVHQDDKLLNGGANEEYISLTRLRHLL